MLTRPMASTSNTAVASGYAPMRGGSPVMQIRLRTPRLCAPSNSLWMPRILRSRQQKWLTASICIGVRAHARRIAGDANQVAHAQAVRPQQFALDAEDIAVAATEVVDGLDAGQFLDQLAGDLRAHARAGAWAIGNVDGVDAVLGPHFRPRELARGIHPARRQNLHEGDELAGGQLGADLGFFGDRNRGQRVRLD